MLKLRRIAVLPVLLSTPLGWTGQIPSGSDVLFRLYVGHHPEVGHLAGGVEVTGAIPGRSPVEVASDRRRSGDVVLTLPTAAEQPDCLHAWYRGLRPEAARRADAAIATIRPASR